MMLVNIGVNVIHPQVREFTLKTEILGLELERECRALENGQSGNARNVEETWKSAMLAFHLVNAAPVGPLQDNSRALLDGIYSWPFQSACGIDLLAIRFANGTALPANLPINVKGLGAIEYLLFERSLTSRCNLNAYPQAAAWSQKPEAAKRLDRCRLANFLSRDLIARAKALDAAWDPKRGNFSKTLIDGSRFASLKDATNALSDSLFSAEKLKDDRIGKPLGRHRDCISDSRKCPEMAEHAWSGIALPAVLAELRGFEAAFTGGTPGIRYGFDDFLRSIGRGDVADTISAGLSASLSSLETLAQGPSLQEQVLQMNPDACAATSVVDRREPLCAFHLELRALVTTLKIDVLAALSLRAPAGHQGDND
jgi:predicted lipoprotein